MLLSLLWTPFPAEAAPRLIKAMLTFLCVLPIAAALPPRSRPPIFISCRWAWPWRRFGALVLSARMFAGDEPGGDEDLVIGVEAALLLLWPALAATHLRNRATLSASLAIIVLAAAVSAPTPGALAATACAALAFVFALWDSRLTGRWLGGISAPPVSSSRRLFRCCSAP